MEGRRALEPNKIQNNFDVLDLGVKLYQMFI